MLIYWRVSEGNPNFSTAKTRLFPWKTTTMQWSVPEVIPCHSLVPGGQCLASRDQHLEATEASQEKLEKQIAPNLAPNTGNFPIVTIVIHVT
jgi:hypothetical protein